MENKPMDAMGTPDNTVNHNNPIKQEPEKRETPPAEMPPRSPDEGGTATPQEMPPRTPEQGQPTPAREDPVPTVAPPAAPQPGMPTPMQYTYRWTYGEQTKFDTKIKKNKRRGGAFTYACMMTVAFLLCFGTLLGVLLTGNFTIQSNAGDISANTEPIYIDRTVYIRTDDDDSGVLTIPEIAAKVKPSVVGIEVETATGTGIGTGIIMTEDGYIATNSHVVNGATACNVIMLDGTEYEARVIGNDEWSDLAVIKIEATGLNAAEFGDSTNLIVGEDVVAIGTPASLEYAGTVTNGIVSAINRDVKIYNSDGTLQKKMTLIQTNVAINPGNSGGPLVNAYGQVIGINSMKLSNGYVGIGFAIPITGAMEILNDIIENNGYSGISSSIVTKRPLIGITGGGIKAGTTYTFEDGSTLIAAVDGVIVVALSEGLDAINKLQVGDIITKVNGEKVETIYDVMNVVNEHNPGDSITLEFYRDGTYHTADIRLGSE